MKVYRSIDEAAWGPLRGGALAIGNFDGVHVAHQALLRKAREVAGARRAKAAALTFEPHPVRVLRPGLAPPLLTPLARKLELLARHGLDVAVVQPFTLAWAATPAADFVDGDLVDRLGVQD